jgi:hypothetical protein
MAAIEHRRPSDTVCAMRIYAAFYAALARAWTGKYLSSQS